MNHLLTNMRTLCEDMQMLSGLSVAYGTGDLHETERTGLAQEVALASSAFIPCP